MEKKKADFKAGKSLTVSQLHECCVCVCVCNCFMFNHILYLQVSGREVFEFRPELVDDDDAEADDTQYDKNKEEEEEVNVSVDWTEKSVCVHLLIFIYLTLSVRLKLLFQKTQNNFCSTAM